MRRGLVLLMLAAGVAPGQWVEGRLDLPSQVTGICHNRERDLLLCALAEPPALAAVDCRTHEVVRTLATDVAVERMVYDFRHDRVYATGAVGSGEASSLLVLEGSARRSWTRFDFANREIREMCHCYADDKLYCLLEWVVDGPREVWAIACSTNLIAGRLEHPALDDATALCYNPWNNKLYVATRTGGVVIFDPAGDTLIGAVDAARGQEVSYMFYDYEHNHVYVASHDGVLLLIDGTDDEVVAELQAVPCDAPPGYNPVEDKLYLYGAGVLSVVNSASPDVLEHLEWGGRVDALDCDITNNRVYAARFDLEEVDIVDGVVDVVTARLPMPGGPTALAWVASTGRMYVVGGGVVTVIRDSLLPEPPGPYQPGLQPAVCARGFLVLPGRERGELVDITGRRARWVVPGANDVSTLAPGLYFLRCGPGLPARKVVLVR